MFSLLSTSSSLPFFSGLAVEDRKALAMHARIKGYSKKQQVCWAGDEARALYVVVAGRVKLYSVSFGSQCVLRVASPGDVIGLVPLFENPAVHSINAEVLTPATFLEVSMPHAKERLSGSVAFREKLECAMAQKVRLLVEAKEVLVMPAAVRVAWLLLQVSRGMQGRGGCFRFPYDKNTAAAELLMSQETFSRSLSQLESVGVTRRDSSIDIENFERLREYVRQGGHCRLQIHPRDALPAQDDLFVRLAAPAAAKTRR